jgi:tetratricopeptide (TPR) repeat protein
MNQGAIGGHAAPIFQHGASAPLGAIGGRAAPILIACAAVLLAPLGASAQSNGTENYYTPPKIKKQGTSQTPLAGNGKVLVKVLINPDGTFKVQGVITSTNHGDDAAALEIARSSTYVPAVRGKKNVLAFYDFALKFNGSGAVSSNQEDTSELGRYERELRAANYAGAQAGFKSYVLAHPGDSKAQLDLAIADTFLNDDADAAAAFDKAGEVPANYKMIAAKAYIEYAVTLINNKDAANGLAAAKHAVEIAPGFASYDTEGVAELLSGDSASALTDLEKAHELAGSDAKIAAKSRAANDVHLMQAYLAAGKVDEARQTGTEATGLDSSIAPNVQNAMANYYIKQAQDASAASKFSDAAGFFEQAAAAAPLQAAGLYANAALSYDKALPSPLNEKAKADADKALAADANNPTANFAEGLTLANLGKKSDAQTFLTKADSLAKAAGDSALADAVEKVLGQLKGGH